MTLADGLVQREFQGQRCIEITLPQGDRALVSLFGAQVLSWQPAGFKEQLYLSPGSVMDASAPIRGGIPICFPQFNQRVLDGHGLPKHGFARTQTWTPRQVLRADTFVEATFELSSNAQTLGLWPYRFAADLVVRLEAGRMRVSFSVRNTGADSWRFALALHSYLAVSDIAQARLDGLGGCCYWDAVKNLHEPQVYCKQAAGPLCFTGETDRIYSGVRVPLNLADTRGRSRISQSDSLPDTVVWNPGEALCAKLKDMPQDGWKHMVCVEAARILEPHLLAPGQSWSGWQQFDCLALA